jgi:predicted O-methyltransferase YrrM
MPERTLALTDDIIRYIRRYGLREHAVLAELREKTEALPQRGLQIAAVQAAFMGLLVKLIGARRILEIATFTGYSSTAMALAMSPEGRMVCCEGDGEWAELARETWAAADVADRIDLRDAPAVEVLPVLDSGSFDLAFMNSAKAGYEPYYEGCLRVVRPGGLILFGNTLWGGQFAGEQDDDELSTVMRSLIERVSDDGRVEHAFLPVEGGLTLVRLREATPAGSGPAEGR